MLNPTPIAYIALLIVYAP